MRLTTYIQSKNPVCKNLAIQVGSAGTSIGNFRKTSSFKIPFKNEMDECMYVYMF